MTRYRIGLANGNSRRLTPSPSDASPGPSPPNSIALQSGALIPVRCATLQRLRWHHLICECPLANLSVYYGPHEIIKQQRKSLRRTFAGHHAYPLAHKTRFHLFPVPIQQTGSNPLQYSAVTCERQIITKHSPMRPREVFTND